VTGISIHPDGKHFSSIGHDGYLRIWDLRNYEVMQEYKAHNEKYNESGMAVAHHPS